MQQGTRKIHLSYYDDDADSDADDGVNLNETKMVFFGAAAARALQSICISWIARSLTTIISEGTSIMIMMTQIMMRMVAMIADCMSV